MGEPMDISFELYDHFMEGERDEDGNLNLYPPHFDWCGVITEFGLRQIDGDYGTRIRDGKIWDRGLKHEYVDFMVPDKYDPETEQMTYRHEEPLELARKIREDDRLHWLVRLNLLHNLETIHNVSGTTTGWCTEVPDELRGEWDHCFYVLSMNQEEDK